MAELIISVLAVVLISATCSLFEAVVLSAPLGHVERLAQEGHRSGIIFRQMRQNIDRPLSAILSRNTIANTGGAAIAGGAKAKDPGATTDRGFTIPRPQLLAPLGYRPARASRSPPVG
ncbi:MAG: DUF21 domain-containing protein [Planctomycetes bacterium]|nr:DUF21 domain-containing protein [Planctomycetota bacterium]